METENSSENSLLSWDYTSDIDIWGNNIEVDLQDTGWFLDGFSISLMLSIPLC